MRLDAHFHKSQRGGVEIIVAMVVAAGLGATVYYAVGKTVAKQQEEKMLLARSRSNQLNISGVSQATSLMTYLAPNPVADDPTVLPYLFPDPYLNNTSVGATRSPPSGVPTWAFNFPALNLFGATGANLHGDDFANYVTSGQRPALTLPSTVTFLGPVMDPSFPSWIRAYRATVTTPSINGLTVSNTAEFPVPPIPPPKCTLSTPGGQTTYQPDNMIDLSLSVAGVALNALVPTTAQQIVAGSVYGDYSGYKLIDTSAKATSIRNMGKNVYSWSVPAPRPLVAVDNTGVVPFTITVFLQGVDNNDPTTTTCTLDITVTQPAYCKLWTDKASVSPGSCANLTYGLVGNVVPGSMVLTAKDLAGNNATSNITQTSATSYQFCAPTSGYASGTTSSGSGSSIPPALAATYSSALSGLTAAQLGAVSNAMQQQISYTNSALSDPTLQNLTIDQVLALLNLTPSQLNNLANLKLQKISGLSTLTSTQVTAIHNLDPSLIGNLAAVDLPSINILSTLPNATLASLATFDPVLLSSYIQGLLSSSSSSTPVDYIITGTVRDTYGGTDSCLTHVTSGVNQCPFFGSNYPNTTANLTLYVNYYGSIGTYPFTFTPGAPNWEVVATANSPFDVTACPADARCFAVDFGTNRTPFVTVEPADSSTCQATVSTRINLGCFAYHTKLRLADGSDREVNTLHVGDLLLNPIKHVPMKIKRTTIGPEKTPLVVVNAGPLHLHVTTKHPMFTRTGVKTANNLRLGDEIMDEHGTWQRLDSLDSEAPRLSVINVELDTASADPADHAVLADGIIAGDLYLQEHMAAAQPSL